MPAVVSPYLSLSLSLRCWLYLGSSLSLRSGDVPPKLLPSPGTLSPFLSPNRRPGSQGQLRYLWDQDPGAGTTLPFW